MREFNDILLALNIREYVARHRTDILVMGAFGHSRLREFILGGASRAIITKPPLPVFMSH